MEGIEDSGDCGDIMKKKRMLLTQDDYKFDREKIHRDLIEVFKNAKFAERLQIPFVSNPIFEKKNKRLKTYHLESINCIEHCIFALANKCEAYHFRRKNRKYIPCWNFTGKYLNLQVCEKCNAVRIVEYPTRIKGLCQKCRGQSSYNEPPDPKLFHDLKTQMIYEYAKHKRMEELKNE